MNELLFKEVELRPELQEYYSVSNGIPMIKHPLCFSIFHVPQQNYRMNQYYEWKTSAVQEALERKEYDTYVFLHERPYRLEAFTEIERYLKDEHYWKLLGEVWVDSENIWQNKVAWGYLLMSDRSGKENFMNEDERAEFEKLPDEFTIYRGYQPRKNKTGFSYTTDEKKAIWFANRFYKDGEVLSRKVKKCKVFAYLTRRNESEIIYF
jgi:hypothetical protein